MRHHEISPKGIESTNEFGNADKEKIWEAENKLIELQNQLTKSNDKFHLRSLEHDQQVAILQRELKATADFLTTVKK